MIEQSPYERLQIPQNATTRDIKLRYRDLVREFTPEHSPEKFMEIRAAYDELMSTSMEAREFFPVYQKPLEFLTMENEESSDSNNSLLSSIFETPYNTSKEIEQLLRTT